MSRLLLVFLLALAALPTATSAQERHMQVELAAESETPRAGSEIAVALVMTPDPGWHGYWLNTGDAGMPDRISWSLPEEASVTPLSYPVPERLIVAGLMNYVYSRPYALIGRLKLPPGLSDGAPVQVVADIDYLVCSDTLCVPEKARARLNLAIGDGAISPALRARFDGWRKALPRPIDAKSHIANRDGRLVLAVPLPDAREVKGAYFYPAEHGVIDYAAAQRIGFSADRLIVEMAPKSGQGAPSRLEGVLRIEPALGEAMGLQIAAVPGPTPKAEGWLAGDTGFALAPFLLTLLAAVAGGFILNAMPCVFPILSLKALSLARSGESEAAARGEATAYSAGVIVTCLALGSVILLLRAGGESIGWAFQLQNPYVVLGLLLLTFAIGLNLAGLFELPSLALGNPASPRNGPSGAFMTGILAAFIATPCTGPFMGAALGGALVLPMPAALGVFAGLGLGLALPFLAIGYIPALRARLPKPGRWMATFRHILAVPMLLTALALGWVLSRQSGSDGLATGTAGAALLALALGWWGWRQKHGRHGGIAAAAAMLAVALPFAFLTQVARAPADQIATAREASFSERRLASLRAEGRPVFVYFTADWCLTCKVNEQAAIERESVRDAFARRNIEVLVGDWTNGDPAISRFLESMGRSGVPLYLFYPGNGGEPQILPQLLTPSMLEQLGG